MTENGVSVVKIGEDTAATGVCAYNDIACMLYFQTCGGDIEAKVRGLFAQKQGESLWATRSLPHGYPHATM